MEEWAQRNCRDLLRKTQRMPVVPTSNHQNATTHHPITIKMENQDIGATLLLLSKKNVYQCTIQTITMANRPALTMPSSLRDSFKIQSFLTFVLGNGFIMIAAGNTVGKVFGSFLDAIVENIAVPSLYTVSLLVFDKKRVDDIFRNVKTRVDFISFLEAFIKFVLGLICMYLLVAVIMLHLLRMVEASSYPTPDASTNV